MVDLNNKRFDLVLTGDEIIFIEFLMIEKLSNLKNKNESRKIFDRIFDKFLLIKNKNKFFENFSADDMKKLFETKTNEYNLDIKKDLYQTISENSLDNFFKVDTEKSGDDIYSMPVSESGIKNNMNDMYQKREVLSFTDFVKLTENAITPVNDEIKTAAPREEGDVNYDRKDINIVTPMDDSEVMSNAQNIDPAPDDIQKEDEKEADKMSKGSEDLNKDSDFKPEEEGDKAEDYNKDK